LRRASRFGAYGWSSSLDVTSINSPFRTALPISFAPYVSISPASLRNAFNSSGPILARALFAKPYTKKNVRPFAEEQNGPISPGLPAAQARDTLLVDTAAEISVIAPFHDLRRSAAKISIDDILLAHEARKDLGLVNRHAASAPKRPKRIDQALSTLWRGLSIEV
jgi:hypothetical protein